MAQGIAGRSFAVGQDECAAEDKPRSSCDIARLPIGSAVHQLIQSAIGIGLGGEDFLSLYEQQARNAALVKDDAVDQ